MRGSSKVNVNAVDVCAAHAWGLVMLLLRLFCLLWRMLGFRRCLCRSLYLVVGDEAAVVATGGADVLATVADAAPEHHDQVVLVWLVLWTGGLVMWIFLSVVRVTLFMLLVFLFVAVVGAVLEFVALEARPLPAAHDHMRRVLLLLLVSLLLLLVHVPEIVVTLFLWFRGMVVLCVLVLGPCCSCPFVAFFFPYLRTTILPPPYCPTYTRLSTLPFVHPSSQVCGGLPV